MSKLENIFAPRNDSQRAAMHVIANNDVTFLLGAAGTGKSFVACAYAVSAILDGRKKIINLTRPSVESGEHMGFLPGTMEDKMNPFMEPLYDCMAKLTSNGSAKKIKEAIKLSPFSYMRGKTFENSICLLDEAQNTVQKQIKLYLTRIGPNTKMIITGDPEQSDVTEPCLLDAIDRLKSVERIGVFRFNNTDIVRHPLIADTLDALKGF